MSTPLLLVTVGEGVELALFPYEDPDAIAADLEAFWDEVTRRPGLGDELTDAEAAALLGEWPPEDEPVSDPNYVRWLAEGAPTCSWTILDDPDAGSVYGSLDDEPGYSESTQPWLW